MRPVSPGASVIVALLTSGIVVPGSGSVPRFVVKSGCTMFVTSVFCGCSVSVQPTRTGVA